MWNWQWACDATPPPAPCVSCNLDVSIRVASPGDDGAVTQSNTVLSQAQAIATAAAGAGTATAAPALPPAIRIPEPPRAPPLTMAPAAGAPERVLAWSPFASAPVVPVVPVVPSVPIPALPAGPVTALAGLPPPLPAARAPAVKRHRHRRVVVHERASVAVESYASTHVVVVQRSVARPTRGSAPAHAPRTATPVERRPPRLPLAPDGPAGPAAAGTAGAGAHGGVSGGVTAAGVAALGLVLLGLLSSFVPTSLPVRRRLSDDRQARPG